MNPSDRAIISTSRLFRDISLESVDYLLDACSIVDFPTGSELLSPDKPNSNLYLVLAGRLSVHLGDKAYTPHVVFEAGDCAGEMSIIDAKPVSAFVIAQENCRLMVIRQETLWALINGSHGVARNLLYILSGRMRYDNEALVNSIKLQREYEHVACTDGLTGLHNRRWLNDSFKRQMNRCERNGHPCSIVMLDIDHFKQMNDRFGHLAGDRILCTVAQVLLKLMRPTDLVARYGGEEFALCLPETPLKGALSIADRLRKAISNTPTPFEEGKLLPTVSVSLGVAAMQPGQSLDSLLSAADSALYRAKTNGRNCVSD
ncbi:MAG: GGDEF domain-containing protein [Pseudomonadota bacterium]|nr:GGDEF domain-containing protein [Pseudomonadota bacterium]